ncbi:hypothetical protein AVEN_80728-1, partial [Araneus ventricosus]
MVSLVRSVGYQILRWKISHQELNARILEQLCWTSTGTVDNKKTAERFVRLEILELEKRYKLACSYCLDNYISLLWNELPSRSKRRFYVILSDSLVTRMPLETYWAYVLEGKESEVNCFFANIFGERFSFYECAFQFSASTGNKAATGYFFQKLSNEERDSSLLKAVYALITESKRYIFDPYPFKHEKDSEVLCYLLSLMNPEHQMQVLKKHPCYVLTRFLYWPWQDLFYDFSDLIWPFLPEIGCGNLIYIICANIRNANYYFPNLIQNFFLRIPNQFRKHFVRTFFIYAEPIFSEISDNEDIETMRVFFRNVDPEYRVFLVLENKFLLFLHNLIMGGKWHFAELCIQEASSSKEDKKRLKEAFVHHFRSGSSIDGILSHSLKRLFKFLNVSEAGAP